jgi:cytochrome c-type biogenesis protein CcsB
MNFPFFELALFFYLLATIAGIFNLLKSYHVTIKGVYVAAGIGFLFHSVDILLRYVNAGHLPIVDFHDAISFFAWSITLLFFFLQYKYRASLLGSFIMPMVLILMFSSSTLPRQIKPTLGPEFDSFWFGVHILFAFLGDAAFALAFSVGIMYLIQERHVKSKQLGGLFRRLPSLSMLDEINYRLISIGFPFLSLAIISGVLWAGSAYGLYWRWDPKEVWSLITWFIYALVLHLRMTTGWRGKKAALLSIAGFAVVLFAFFGIKLLQWGYHRF